MIPTLPDVPDDISAAWIASPEGKKAIVRYLAAVKAMYEGLQIVVIKNGVRQPPVSISPGDNPVIEITV